jgi:hypothetical protein
MQEVTAAHTCLQGQCNGHTGVCAYVCKLEQNTFVPLVMQHTVDAQQVAKPCPV